jgi:hypothetical protein
VVSELEQKRPWWHAFITPQNVLTAILAIFAAGGYWQDAKRQKERNDEQDRRMERIEQRFDNERETSERIYMRRETMESELRALRVEIQGLRKDLR